MAEQKQVSLSKTKKIRVLTLSDSPLSSSGIGIQASQLIRGLLDTGRYQVYSIGGAIAHNNYQPQVVSEYNGDWIIYPTKGFGDEATLKQWMLSFKPDIVLAFTDPRFFMHLFKNEDEIRDMAPLMLWTVWDNEPTPTYNKDLYNSCDDIAFFSRYSYDFHQSMKDMVSCDFHCVPLGREDGVFYPMEAEARKAARRKIFGKDSDKNMYFLYVSRNARRKRPTDLLQSFKILVENLSPKQLSERPPKLIMHCDPFDHEGANLIENIAMLDLGDYVAISNSKLTNEDMNALYNSVDCTINLSLNEGFGMSVHESLLAGTPVIATKTGGMTEQMTDGKNVFGLLMSPDQRNLVGSQLVPYIYEDLVACPKIAAFMKTMYEKTDEERKSLGLMGREYLLENNKVSDIINFWDNQIQKRLEEYKKPERIRFKVHKM
jgi:glycosyltransferase involved in cell wall biosynthesis